MYFCMKASYPPTSANAEKQKVKVVIKYLILKSHIELEKVKRKTS